MASGNGLPHWGFDPDEPEISQEDAAAVASLEWIAGHMEGYLGGFNAGVEIGREQGFDNALWRFRNAMLQADIDYTDVERVINMVQGE